MMCRRQTRPPLRGALGVAVLMLAATAAAEEDASEESSYARQGIYVGGSFIGATYTRAEDELEDEFARRTLVPLGFDVEDPLGFQVLAGLRITPHFGVELQYDDLFESDVSLDGFGEIGELDAWSLTASLKLHLLTGRAQPFLRLGAGYMRVDVEDSLNLGQNDEATGAVVRVGGGLDVYVIDSIAVFGAVDYVSPQSSDLEDIDYLSYGGGLLYRF